MKLAVASACSCRPSASSTAIRAASQDPTARSTTSTARAWAALALPSRKFASVMAPRLTNWPSSWLTASSSWIAPGGGPDTKMGTKPSGGVGAGNAGSEGTAVEGATVEGAVVVSTDWLPELEAAAVPSQALATPIEAMRATATRPTRPEGRDGLRFAVGSSVGGK